MADFTTKRRYVAYLDIMGFKEWVASTETLHLYEALTAFNKDITDIINQHNKVNFTASRRKNEASESEGPVQMANGSEILISQFSDSIILYSMDDSVDSLKAISKITKSIFVSAIKRERPIPLRGALALGIMTCDPNKQVFFGQALIDAYQLEENIIYYGFVVHHTAEQSVISHQELGLYVNKSLPFRSGSIEHFELEWYKGYIEDVNRGLDSLRLTASESPRRYIDNTRKIISR